MRDQALLAVRWIIRAMLKNRPDILRALAKHKVRQAAKAKGLWKGRDHLRQPLKRIKTASPYQQLPRQTIALESVV